MYEGNYKGFFQFAAASADLSILSYIGIDKSLLYPIMKLFHP
jgi:hypothetical protein